jgi:hypothetical protein
MFEAFIKYVLGEFRMIWEAPLSFVTCVAAMFLIVWFAMDWRYGGVISNKDSELSLAKAQRDDYRDKLGGATPDQAKAKIEALEKTIHLTMGARWEPLTKSQIADLAAKLKDIKKSRAQIMYENALGRELAQSILEAFQQAEWDGAWLSTGSGFGDGIVTGWSTRAESIRDALIAAKLPGVWAKDTNKEIADLLIVGVGINSY